MDDMGVSAALLLIIEELAWLRAEPELMARPKATFGGPSLPMLIVEFVLLLLSVVDLTCWRRELLERFYTTFAIAQTSISRLKSVNTLLN